MVYKLPKFNSENIEKIEQKKKMKKFTWFKKVSKGIDEEPINKKKLVQAWKLACNEEEMRRKRAGSFVQ